MEEERNIWIKEEAKLFMDKVQFDYDSAYDIMVTFVDQGFITLKEIEICLATHDFKQIAMKFHKLKGSAATVQVERLRIQFEQGEKFARQEKQEEIQKCLWKIESDVLFKKDIKEGD